eukprot:sb/3467374/
MEELQKKLSKLQKDHERAKQTIEQLKLQHTELTKQMTAQMEKTKLKVSEDEGEEETQTSKLPYITKPPKMNKGDSFINYCDRFKSYCEMTGFRRNLDLLFLQNVDSDTYTTLKYAAQNLTEVQKRDADEVCKQFTDAMFSEETISLKCKLLNLRQKATETVTEFCNRIEELAGIAYDSPDAAQEACLIALLTGVSDSKIRRKLNEDLTITDYSQAVRFAKRLEQVANMLEGEPSRVMKVREEPIITYSDLETASETESSEYLDTDTDTDSDYSYSQYRDYRSRSREQDQRDRVPRSSRD